MLLSSRAHCIKLLRHNHTKINNINMNDDSLQYLPTDRWEELEKLIEADWPRSISVLAALRTQRQLETLGLGYGFKVYCPYGEPTNGMVALNNKASLKEIILYCPQTSIKELEKALLTTNLVNWKKPLIIPFLPKDLFKCMERISQNINVEIENEDDHSPHFIVLLDKKTPPFENISMSEDINFQLLKEEHIDTVDKVWPNRYDGSTWMFQLLIKAKFGYGLFKNDKLISCVFLNEVGSLCHMFTFEAFRNKGYGTILLKLVCNKQLKQNKNTFGYCEKGNIALQLYKKLGFEVLHTIQWCFIKPKQ